MSEPSLRPPSIPVSYRLALALSLAVLVHTLLFAGLPSPLKDARQLSHRLVLELSAPASPPVAATLANSDSASRPVPRPETERPLTPIAQRQPHIPPETLEHQTPSTQANAGSAKTTALPSKPTDQQKLAQQITRTPVEQDPYRILLATHLAATLERQRVPAMSKLNATVTMELELRIRPNGALTRARVVKSTGVPEIDEAAYRAALAASPYPEPEAENSDRFGVRLVFAPKRY